MNLPITCVEKLKIRLQILKHLGDGQSSIRDDRSKKDWNNVQD